MVPLLARYRQALDLGEVVVLDGAGYSRENLRTLEGFSWILRVPATLKEARARLEGEFPREAWTPLLPGYRGLEVECGYGGVRQRWLLVEREARAREEAGGRLPCHRLVHLGVQGERHRGRVGRPRKGEAPLAVSYRLLARLEVDPGKLERARRGLGRFLLATNVLDREALPALEVLGRYKDQTPRVERGFRFLKDPLFFSGSPFLKRPERVMALGEWVLRQRLEETASSLPDQKGKPTQRPTLRWVFQLFLWVRLAWRDDRPLVLNLTSHHETAVRLLGAQRYYLLE